jgi:hypothetical protein
MPRKSKTDELREKFEVAIAKSLESDSAAERTQALRSAGDLLNPNLTDLQKQVKQAEDAREVAETALIPLTGERDTLLARVNELQPLADRLPGVEAELSTLKAGNDEWKAEQHKLLVAEAQQCKWDAQRAERESKEALKTAQAEFTKKGYDALLDAMRDLVAANKISQPDIWNLPKNVNPIFLTLWQNWTLTKAQYFVALTQGYPEPNEGFRQMLIRCLTAALPIYGGIKPDPVENLAVKTEVLMMMCQQPRWNGVLESAQRQVEEEQIHRQAAFLRNHYADLAAAQHASSLRAEGRTPISVEEPVSVTGYTGECIDPEHCCCPKHKGLAGLPPHLYDEGWLGNKPTEKIEDINARHEVTETLDYGRQLIEREAAAKKRKTITVLPPESVTLDGHHSLDDEETL